MGTPGFSANDYTDSTQDYAQNWKTLDEVLYRLCRDHPHHNDPAAVNAKLYIIGRTFATGIERKIRTSGAQGSSMSKVSAFVVANHHDIDSRLVRLRKISEPLTTLSFRKILLLHGLLVNQLKNITINKQSARSFVSKYLHFHNPAVPIYDSVAAGVLPSLVRTCTAFRPVRWADPDYTDYVQRFAKLYQDIASQCLPVTVRSVDYYLIWKADRDRP